MAVLEWLDLSRGDTTGWQIQAGQECTVGSNAALPSQLDWSHDLRTLAVCSVTLIYPSQPAPGFITVFCCVDVLVMWASFLYASTS